jgi:F-type H+-transporting ATPase subunit delta
VQENDRFRLFLESPRVSAHQKNEIIGKALEGVGTLPRTFVLFVQALVTHRRQMLIPAIANEYHDLVDVVKGRVHASVTVARTADAAEQAVIVERLSKAFGKEVIPHYYVNAAILGGVVVRVGDTVLDGSVRRRLATLKTRMLAGA